MTSKCECSEDFGPCEDHCTVYAQREGSAVRTGDELAAVYVGDAASIFLTSILAYIDDATNEMIVSGPYSMTPGVTDAIVTADDYWEAHPNGGWCEDTDDSEALTDACRTMEDALGAEGFWTLWEDGYIILKPTDDCPLVDQDDGGHAERAYFAAGEGYAP